MEHECAICYEEYQASKRAMRTPCGHNICDPCLKKLTPMVDGKGKTMVKNCPYCRLEFRATDCDEDLTLQEETNTAVASRLKYPFHNAPCSKCAKSANFADLFVCYACYPSLMQNAMDFKPETMKNKVMCLRCEAQHRPLHGEKPFTTLPIAIYTTENLSEIQHIVVSLFRHYTTGNIAPFALGLIRGVIERQEEPKASEKLLRFLIDDGLKFLDYIKEYTTRVESRAATRLFLRSYWTVLKIFADHSLPGPNWLLSIMTCVEKAAKVGFVMQESDGSNDPPYMVQVAREEFIWTKCYPIMDAIWRQALSLDKAQMGQTRIDVIMKLLWICRHVFPNADTFDFLDSLVVAERREIRAALPGAAARDRLLDYQKRIEEEFDEIDLQGAERHMELERSLRQLYM